MAERVAAIMKPEPRTVPPSATFVDVARIMRDDDIGDVVVVVDGAPTGVVTDRDIVVRGLARELNPGATPVGEIASRDLHTLTPDQTLDDAARVMQQWDVRRVLVVESGRPVGMVSLGDLAIESDPGSVLADISSEPPTP
jgi:CBS domain-containing protein